MGNSNDNGVPRPNARIFNISNKLLVPNQLQLSTLKHLSVKHLSKVRLGRLCRVTSQGEYIYFFPIFLLLQSNPSKLCRVLTSHLHKILTNFK